MPAQTPADLDRLFEEYMNKGHIDAILTLYEPNAAMPDQAGQVAMGLDALRTSIGAFAAMKPQLDLKVEKVIETGDIALVYSKWTMKAGGQEMAAKGREVARRQADGTWRFVIDDPFGGS